MWQGPRSIIWVSYQTTLTTGSRDKWRVAPLRYPTTQSISHILIDRINWITTRAKCKAADRLEEIFLTCTRVSRPMEKSVAETTLLMRTIREVTRWTTKTIKSRALIRKNPYLMGSANTTTNGMARIIAQVKWFVNIDSDGVIRSGDETEKEYGILFYWN